MVPALTDDDVAVGHPPVLGPGEGLPEPDHRRAPWHRVLVIGVLCFVVWLLLDAPSLQRSAQVSPLGTRRTVALDVLGPLAAVSRGLGLSHVMSVADGLIGRTPGGGPALAVAHPVRTVTRHDPPATAPTTSVPAKGHGRAPQPTPTTTTFPPLAADPSAAAPLRVLAVGDSIGIDLGQPLVDDLAATGVVHAVLDGKVDTGLARPDYFNWPAELQVDLGNDSPQLVVVMMGANDPQSMLVDGRAVAYGTAAWDAAYAQRVGSFIDEATATGAHVLWVGMPPMQSPQLNAEMQHINAIDAAQVAARPGRAAYLSSWNVLGGPSGTFTAYLPGPSGAEINVRTPDGTHLTPGGGQVLAEAVIAAIRTDFHVALPG